MVLQLFLIHIYFNGIAILILFLKYFFYQNNHKTTVSNCSFKNIIQTTVTDGGFIIFFKTTVTDCGFTIFFKTTIKDYGFTIFFKTIVTNCGFTNIFKGNSCNYNYKKYEILELCLFIFNFSISYGCTKIS